MPKRHPKPLKLRELLDRLSDLGVEQFPMHVRGKGSEIILVKPKAPGERRGPQYPIKNRGMGTEIHLGTLNACLRKLGIEPETFWDY
jgi:hypothetical protein